MATLKEQLKRVKSLNEKNLETEIFKFLKSIEKDLIKLNQDQLENNSTDIHGDAIGFYSRATEAISKGAKKFGEPFSGKDTGDFFNKMYLQNVSNVIRFGSNSPHFAEIKKSKNWLSTDIVGLTDENLEKVIKEKIKPFLLSYIRNKLQI